MKNRPHIMNELSLYILDIVQNSVEASATKITLGIVKDVNGFLTVNVTDNGCGIDKAEIGNALCRGYSSKGTNRGNGLFLFDELARKCNGYVKIVSDTDESHGTAVTAVFDTNSSSYIPLGSIEDTVSAIIQGNPEIDFEFFCNTGDKYLKLSTNELHDIFGNVPLNDPEVITGIRKYLSEQ